MYLVKWSSKVTQYLNPSTERIGEGYTLQKINSRGVEDEIVDS